MKKVWQDFDNAMFRYGSPVTLGVFRIVFCSLVFIALCLLGPFAKIWFTEQGFVPVATAQAWNGQVARFNPLANVTNPTVVYLCFALLMVAVLMTLVGYKTRIASICMVMGIVAFHMRNPLILNGGDSLVRATSFLLAISPCGAAVSLDRKFAVKKGKAPAIPPDISIWPQRLIQWQLAVLYITTVWDKWGGNTWRDGTATYYPLNMPEFHRLWVPEFFRHMPWIGITTYGTLIIELAMGTLVFSRPFRNWVLASGLALHASLEYMFNIPMFQWIISSLYICHIDGEEWIRWFEHYKAKRNASKNAKEVSST